jgi:hypothetical protein
LFSAAVGDLPGAANAEVLFRDGWIDETEYQQLVRGSRTQQGEVLSKVARRRMGTDGQSPPLEGGAVAPTVTIQGPNGPVTVSTAEPPAAAPPSVAPAAPEDFASPLAAAGQLRFGPGLGAPTRTSEEVMVDEFVSSIGVDPYAPPPIELGAPGQPGRAITDLLTQRDQQAQWAQALIEAEQYGDAQTVQAGIAAIDAKLEAAVARQAIEEARDFNAPQRLNAIWSENRARNYEFVPVAPGVFDVYIDGQPQSSGVPIDQITQETLFMSDQVYAGRQAELAMLTESERAKGMGQAAANVYEYGQKADIDVQKALQVGLTEIDLATIKSELGFGETDQINFETDETTGIILVFRNGVPEAQYAPTTIAPEGVEPYVSFQRID